jgi:anti-sigma-K factor RskA
MRYDNADLRDILAAEYVLGTLRGVARRRFESLAAKRNDWQTARDNWGKRLHLLADTVAAVTPRQQVWNKIEARLFAKPLAAKKWWQTADWWRGLALGSTSIAAVLAVVMVTRAPDIIEVPVIVAVKVPVEVAAPTTVALLVGEDANPGWMLALSKNVVGQAEVSVMTLASLKPIADKTFELWVLPPDQAAPISLGIMPQIGNKKIAITAKLAELLLESGLAVSVEPMGGSPTGAPTGAVMFQGKLTLM